MTNTKSNTELSSTINALLSESKKVIVGQNDLLERLLIGVLCNGHLLLEGVPGLAKTLSVQTLATLVDASFKRIQFTPDMIPADILGTMVYNQQKDQFSAKLGPIFSHIILADEINRAPAKVQSALLEAMQEGQVTIGGKSFPLPSPFLVLATQNPIEQEGTYPLPEAQVDRFFMKLSVDYPTRDEERQILDRMGDTVPEVNKVVGIDQIAAAKSTVSTIYCDDRITNYILDIVLATRNPSDYKLIDLAPLIAYGASPRASLALVMATRAHALIKGRDYVTPEDVKAIGKDVLRHRVIPSFEAEAEELSSDDLIDRLLSEIPVP